MPDQYEIFLHVTLLDMGMNEENGTFKITVTWSGAVTNRLRQSPAEVRLGC